MIYQNIDETTFPQLFNNSLYVKILSMIGTGNEQGIHVNDICRVTGLDNRSARKAIETIRRAGVVICTDHTHGYYYPDTLNELELYLRQEEHRGRSTFYTLKSARQLYNRCMWEAKT